MKKQFITQYDTARARTFLYKAAGDIELICKQAQHTKNVETSISSEIHIQNPLVVYSSFYCSVDQKK